MKRRAASKSSRTRPRERTRAFLRKLGFEVATVEHWNSYTRRMSDLWGLDVLAVKEKCIVGVQATSAKPSDMQRRCRKMQTIRGLVLFARAEGLVFVFGWKKGAREPLVLKGHFAQDTLDFVPWTHSSYPFAAPNPGDKTSYAQAHTVEAIS